MLAARQKISQMTSSIITRNRFSPAILSCARGLSSSHHSHVTSQNGKNHPAVKLKMAEVTSQETEIPLLENTLAEYFAMIAKRYPTSEALVVPHQQTKWNYKQLDHHATRFAMGLLKLGLKKGDRLAVWLPNTYQYVLAQIGAARIGVILVTINPAYRQNELAFALSLVGAKCLLMQPSLRSSDYLQMVNNLIPELVQADSAPGKTITSTKFPELKHIINIGKTRIPGMLQFEDVMPKEAEVPAVLKLGYTLSQHDEVNIQFTSGTTGNPKGASLTHRNILNNGFFVGERLKLTPKDKICIPVPLYHCFGMVLGNIAAFTHGAAMVYPTEVFDPEAVLKTVEAEECTCLYGVPTMFISELNHQNFKKYNLSSLRSGIMAGSICPLETMKEVISLMHMKEITIVYGMTETSPGSFQSLTTDPVHLRVETVGRIHPHLSCKVVDEHGKTVPVNVPGELLVKGYSVFKGYWGNPAKTAEVIKDGWMHTGDQVTIDEDGYCRIVGRLKDIIIRGGENLSPREIEDVLFENHKVLVASVFAVPDPFYGEEACAWVILKEGVPATPETEKALRDDMKKHLAHFKIPKYLMFKKEIPMTVTGKVQKFVMREHTIKELHLKGKK